MIIICPCGDKRFEVDESLIPEKGRLLKCGSCDQTWFFDKNKQINDIVKNIASPSKKITKRKEIVDNDKSIKSNKNLSQEIDKIVNKKEKALVKYQKDRKFTFSKLLSYTIVLIISFIGAVIVVDTFKTPLYEMFPELETLLFSLFETLKDIELFIKDLS